MSQKYIIFPGTIPSCLDRFLNILLLFSTLFLWYLIITNKDALRWYLIDEFPRDCSNFKVAEKKGVDEIEEPTQPAIELDLDRVLVGNKDEKPPGRKEGTMKATLLERNKLNRPDKSGTDNSNIPEPFKTRNKQIMDQCGSDGNPSFEQNNNMYYFPDLQATWVPLFGEHCILWKRFFIEFFTDQDEYHIEYLANFLLSDPRKEMGRKQRGFLSEPDGSLRFTVIRHPLTNLVATFLKPLDRSQEAKKHDLWIRPSIIHSRTDPRWTDSQKSKLERELDVWLTGRKVKSGRNPYLSAPTFPEFIRYILDTGDMGVGQAQDIPWRPISERLDICQSDIDIIIKQENAKTEIHQLLDKLGVAGEYEGYFADYLDGEEDIDVEDYLRQLTPQEKERLNDLYKMDYIYFGYGSNMGSISED